MGRVPDATDPIGGVTNDAKKYEDKHPHDLFGLIDEFVVDGMNDVIDFQTQGKEAQDDRPNNHACHSCPHKNGIWLFCLMRNLNHFEHKIENGSHIKEEQEEGQKT